MVGTFAGNARRGGVCPPQQRVRQIQSGRANPAPTIRLPIVVYSIGRPPFGGNQKRYFENGYRYADAGGGVDEIAYDKRVVATQNVGDGVYKTLICCNARNRRRASGTSKLDGCSKINFSKSAIAVMCRLSCSSLMRAAKNRASSAKSSWAWRV